MYQSGVVNSAIPVISWPSILPCGLASKSFKNKKAYDSQ